MVVSTVVCAQQVRMPPNSEQSCVGVQDQLIQLISSADCKCDVWMTKSGTTAAQACLFRKLGAAVLGSSSHTLSLTHPTRSSC